ncbi:NAD(P)-dependent oxidoreductase [Sphaerochaeta pleomorpha]|uniref:NAD(P)-dependent oxidoreductase n=1 Tax=Sphaerochaeta pleomorpha TaxID=1131707 RepID=UPI00059DC809|nr:NAD(P)-dependent oxidoreductase [Sphaerochaeta pleomorpha]
MTGRHRKPNLCPRKLQPRHRANGSRKKGYTFFDGNAPKDVGETSDDRDDWQGLSGLLDFGNLAPKILNGNFQPSLAVDHFARDSGIALEESENRGLCLPTLALAL